MFSPITETILGVVNFTWPMVIISSVIVISLRLTYLIKNKEKFVFYKELFMLTFIIYILTLFQVVTFEDVNTWATNNFMPFKEIFRYQLGSRLFFKNVLGNVVMFIPYGVFVAHYLKLKRWYGIIVLALIASVSIETVQLHIGRVFDIDDILLNVAGAFLGFCFYRSLEMIGNKIPNLFKKEWIYNILAILALVLLITMI